MADDERIRTLLWAAAAIEDSRPAPVDRLVAVGRRSVHRRRVAVAALAVLATAAVVVVPTVVITNHSHHLTATGPTDPATPSPVSTSTVPTSPSPLASMTAYPTTGPGTAASLAHAHWSVLPDAPITGRSGAASVWTGQLLLVWGGDTDKGEAGDGASYDPAARTWQLLPAAPLGPRSGVASAWTGSQWFLWGGQRGLTPESDGALYDPATRTWSSLPPGPLSGRRGATAVWNGSEILVLGGEWGSGRLTSPTDSAAYNPATRQWRLLAPNPALPAFDVHFVAATATGQHVYVADNWSNSGSGMSGVALSTYDAAADMWAPVAVPGDSHSINQLIWTGRDLLDPPSQIWCGMCSHPGPSGEKGHRLPLGEGAWTAMPHGPLDDFTPFEVWTGAALVVPPVGGSSSGPSGTVSPGDAAAWDATTNRWVTLPPAPAAARGSMALWTGRELLVWGLAAGALSGNAVGASLG